MLVSLLFVDTGCVQFVPETLTTRMQPNGRLEPSLKLCSSNSSESISTLEKDVWSGPETEGYVTRVSASFRARLLRVPPLVHTIPPTPVRVFQLNSRRMHACRFLDPTIACSVRPLAIPGKSTARLGMLHKERKASGRVSRTYTPCF